MAHSMRTRQIPELFPTENLRYQPHALVQANCVAVASSDPTALLPSMLQGVQPQVGKMGGLQRLNGAVDPKHPAFFPGLVYPYAIHSLTPLTYLQPRR